MLPIGALQAVDNCQGVSDVGDKCCYFSDCLTRPHFVVSHDSGQYVPGKGNKGAHHVVAEEGFWTLRGPDKPYEYDVSGNDQAVVRVLSLW
jgi:hypothetical protein